MGERIARTHARQTIHREEDQTGFSEVSAAPLHEVLDRLHALHRNWENKRKEIEKLFHEVKNCRGKDNQSQLLMRYPTKINLHQSTHRGHGDAKNFNQSGRQTPCVFRPCRNFT